MAEATPEPGSASDEVQATEKPGSAEAFTKGGTTGFVTVGATVSMFMEPA